MDGARNEGASGAWSWPREAESRCPLVRRERRDAAEHRRRILAVARTLFAAHGVDAVTMQQIARGAGVGQGTLYRRFAHKGLLCLALLEEGLARFRDDLAAELDRADFSALQRLDALLMRLIAFNEENGPLLSAVVESSCSEHPGVLYRSPFYRWLVDTVAGLLERASDAGEIRSLDAVYTAHAILAALAIELYSYQRAEEGFTPERIAAALRSLYLHGLAARSARPGQPAGQTVS
jgi:AcrR family transcriptional regulator